MRNFLITVNGKQYEVGVEELGETASSPKAVPLSAAPTPQPAPVAAGKGTKVLSPFPGLIKNLQVNFI